MLAVEWQPHARADLLAIIAAIADENPDAAQRLKEEIQARTASLAQHPRLYRAGRVKGTRELVVRPNYVVVYTERPGIVSILRVLHTARQWPVVAG